MNYLLKINASVTNRPHKAIIFNNDQYKNAPKSFRTLKTKYKNISV